MKNALILLEICMAFSINAQNNPSIGNECWKHEAGNGVHFIMYYFSDTGTYMQYFGYAPRNYMNQVTGFMHTLVRGKYHINENNGIELEITSKTGFDKYLDFADVHTLTLNITGMNDDNVEIKFPVENGTITVDKTFARLKNINEADVMETCFGIPPGKDALEKYVGVSASGIDMQKAETKIGHEKWYNIYMGPSTYVFPKDDTFINYPILSQMEYKYQPQIHGKYTQENSILNFEKTHLFKISETDFAKMEFPETLEILQINEYYIKLKYTEDNNAYTFFVGRRKLQNYDNE